MPPLRLKPIYKDYLWGGDRLRTLFGRKTDPLKKVAESWEIANHPHGESVILDGICQGMTFGRLFREFPAMILGSRNVAGNGRFPLLFKYLDAAESLSVQVHPNDTVSRTLGIEEPGKTEAWVVLDVEPGSVLWIGFRKRYTRREIKRAIGNGTIVEMMQCIEPRIGDSFLIEAGTVHALGSGIMVAEIQRNSDTTFRLFDWNRTGADGRKRPLHIAEGCRSIDLNGGSICRGTAQMISADNESLFCCESFRIQRRTLSESSVWKSDGCCHLWALVEGTLGIAFEHRDVYRRNSANLRIVSEQTIVLQRGDTLLIPACCREIVWKPDRAVLLDIAVH